MTQIFLDTGRVIPVTVVSTIEDIDNNLLNKNVEVVGKSKGKGFTGVMKRWGFSGQQATRGQSDKPRAAGAIGAQTPGKVFKGKKMAGRLGNKRVTISGLKIVYIDQDNKQIMVSGPIPGARNSEITIKVVE